MGNEVSLEGRIQEARYVFPYHHIPELRERVALTVATVLPWGLEYLTYESFVLDLITQRRPTSLLDVGCGDGRLLSDLEGIVPTLVGVDVSERATLLARALCPNARILRGTASELTDVFEAATCIETLEHVPDEQVVAFLGAIRERLMPQGLAVFCVPTTVRPLNAKHYRHFTDESLRAMLSPFFIVQETHWLYRICVLERCISAILCNRLFALRNRTLGRLVWQLHRRYSYSALPGAGAHVVAVCEPR